MEMRQLDKFNVPTLIEEKHIGISLAGSIVEIPSRGSIFGIAQHDASAGDIISIAMDGKWMVSGC